MLGPYLVVLVVLWLLVPLDAERPLLFGLVFSLTFAWLGISTMHVLSTRWIKGPERWRVCQQAELLVELPPTQALDRCEAAIRDLPHFKRMGPRTGESVEARTAMTVWSFGERISCAALALDARHTRVVVSSRPTLATTGADYGRNWANVLTIRRAITG